MHCFIIRDFDLHSCIETCIMATFIMAKFMIPGQQPVGNAGA
jgi:hypothetical protein